MKILILFLALSLLGLSSFCQNKAIAKYPSDTLPYTYLGLGTGINNYVGIIGVGADVRVYHEFFIRIGAGLGSWGGKLTGGIRYERKYTSGWGYGISYSQCSGLNDYKYDFETVSSTLLITKNVTMDLLKVRTINLTAFHNWVFKKKNKFYIEFGYAIPLDKDAYKLQDPTIILSDKSKSLLTTLQPGGIIISTGFMFGL